MRKKIFCSLSIMMFFGLSIVLNSCSSDNSSDSNSTESPKITNVKTFNNVKVAFGDGMSQSATNIFTFPSNMEDVKTIKMYVKDICPNNDCDEWDRYANVYAKDKETGIFYEIGRFITPYWVGNEKLERGYEFDVTDFKSILNLF